VAAFLEVNFSDLMDIDFTADMEDDLDKISMGNLQWDDTIGDFWKHFSPALDGAKKFIKKEKQTNFTCPQCGKNLLLRVSPYTNDYGVNKFFSCEGWSSSKKKKTCDYSVDAKYDANGDLIPLSEKEQKKQAAKRKNKKTIYLEKNGKKVTCPACGNGNIVQRSRKKDGKHFWACDEYPKCKTIVDEDLNILNKKK